jgi:hypothetical protein
MSWIGLLLVGVATTDLVFSLRPSRHLPEAVGVVVLLGLGLLAGLTSVPDLVAMLLMALVVVAWGRSVTRGLGAGPAGLPLLVLAGGLGAVIVVAPFAGVADGLVARWVEASPLPVLDGLTGDRALLLAGVLLVQLSTGNVVVRLVLAATHTVNPARDGTPSDPATRLKGGRLLGPMERVFIVALGLGGHVTAASIVVAAKGLLRFPELQSRREQERIHRLTEYFLVGSFASWLVALGGLVLLA